MIGTPLVEVIVVETAALASSRLPEPSGNSSWSTQMLKRLFAGTV